jgi:hypothetical protein
MTDPPAVPDNALALAQAMVEKLTALVEQEPTEFNVKALRGWLHEMAHPTRYRGEEVRQDQQLDDL